MDPAAQPLLATAEHDHEADGRITVVPGNGNKHAEDAEAEEMSTSMQSRLEESSTASAGAGDEADEDDEDEVDEVEESQVTNKRIRSCKYKTEEDKYLCEAWLTISLDAMVGADQTKEKF